MSRRSTTLFFAIPTRRNDGARYILPLYLEGCRNFVVPPTYPNDYPDDFVRCHQANFYFADDPVLALQLLAARHRAAYTLPVVGITGSNGKTIVKEWLVQLLGPEQRIVSSPRSYNSQIGAPWSVWQIDRTHTLGIFEAGISHPGEMARLRPVIDPTIGIITNIGRAHDENFNSRKQKISEKLKLFTHCRTLIYCDDQVDIRTAVATQRAFASVECYTWGHNPDSSLRIISSAVRHTDTLVTIEPQGADPFTVAIPFTDRASLENALHCVALLTRLGYAPDVIARRCLALAPVEMRLERDEALNGSLLVNDAYSLDLDSLAIALDYLDSQTDNPSTTLILSDIPQTGIPEPELYTQVSKLVAAHSVGRLIGIGPALMRHRALFSLPQVYFYPDTDTFIASFDFGTFRRETILLKGARSFHFEQIVPLLRRKNHQTVLTVNLSALGSNLDYYRSLLKPGTRLMAMVKAASYGAGKYEVAHALQNAGVDYLTVAYADEGVDLRRQGITLPIMVMNPEEQSFPDIIRHRLQPDIYSFATLHSFARAVRRAGIADPYPVHVELDTGMHRLGFARADISQLAALFSEPFCPLRVESIFSHLACADNPSQDAYTLLQLRRFASWSSTLRRALPESSTVLCHILNSSGIERFPQYQMDMVRLGIGLYGISPQPTVQSHLRPVSTLTTRISQIKTISKGDGVGYNRRWVASRVSRVAVIAIGYADGLNRHLGCGNGCALVGGQEVPIIGSVCMDMCFLDVTDVSCREGDEVTLFGPAELLCRQAEGAGTIPYELLTAVSPRVKRVYIQE